MPLGSDLQVATVPVQFSTIPGCVLVVQCGYLALWPARDPVLSNDTAVTVGIPYYRCPDGLVRAVESILAQTHRNLRCIVLNDADPESPRELLRHIDDPRLLLFDFGANRGRYFADAVAVEATCDSYYLIQDADDWSALERCAKLLSLLRDSHADAAFSTIMLHDSPIDVGRRVSYADRLARPVAPRLSHRVGHHGLFRVGALRRRGGYYGGLRVGFDTLVVALLELTGSIAYLDEPVYHRLLRSGSLTASPDSGFGSALRLEAHKRIGALYQEVFVARERYAAGNLDLDGLLRVVREGYSSGISPNDLQALAFESARLRHALDAAR